MNLSRRKEGEKGRVETVEQQRPGGARLESIQLRGAGALLVYRSNVSLWLDEMIAGIVAPDAGSNFSHIDGVIVALLPDCTPMRYSYSRRYGHRIKRPPLSLSPLQN